MDKYEQIIKLVEAHALIQNVIDNCDPALREQLQNIADDVADIADDIERAE